jgi:L-alanine-DL-glutamate epimerase-like enolase superfamily enzyme
VSLGESERTSKVFPAIHEMGAGHLQPQVHKMGSVAEWLEVKELCETKGLILSCGGIAPLAAQMITACDESYAMCEYLRPTMRDIPKYMKTPPRMADGRYYLEHNIGLGMDYDWDSLGNCGLIRMDLSC